jgi:MFS transporter, FSR family, fosmidomycin resistance protein
MNPSHEHHGTRTLWLVGILHAFTHLYQVALMPLYLAMVADLKLASVEEAGLLVSAMMMAVFLPSYPMGVLADRMSPKKLLATGLLVNAAGFVGLAFARSFGEALACVIAAGLGGSFYHPAATGLVVRLFPDKPGRSLGLTAIGASVGFFVGPMYAGWRAQADGWRAPVLELGLAGLAMAAAFWWLADEATARRAERAPAGTRLFPGVAAMAAFFAMALFFASRDFAGSGNGTLSSLFLQNAHGDTLAQAGRALSLVFLASAVSNPVFGHLSDRNRSAWVLGLLMISAVGLVLLPHLTRGWFEPGLVGFGFFFMATYPIVEAELMKVFPDSARGRMFGLFITVGGMVGNLSHWVVGRWVHELGPAGRTTAAYAPIYATLAGLIVVSLAAIPCLRWFRAAQGAGPTAVLPATTVPAP